jgi:peptide/nickel transport system permease protein
VYAEIAGLRKNKILTQYIIRTAMLPQLTALAMSLGTVFSGALIMEVVFGYPGIGSLTLRAIYTNDYSMIMDHRYSIIGVATVFIMDLLTRYLTRGCATNRRGTMLKVLRDLRHDGQPVSPPPCWEAW